MLLEQVILYDTRANQPAANTVATGSLYYVTDESVTERSNGATWDDFSDAASGGVTTTGSPASGNLARFSGAATITNTDLTGDVTTSGTVATTIANNAVTTAKIIDDAVTYAKIQDVSATDRILGRDTAAAGIIEELSVSGGLEFTGGPGIQRSALTGDVTATAGSNATTIANNAVTTAKIIDDAVTYAKMQDISATDRLLGRDTAAAGNTEEIPVSAGLEFTGGPGLRTTLAVRTFTVGITIDGGGSAITTGVKGYVQVPVAGTIVSWTILADQGGAIVIDVWKDTYANFPPVNADSITGTDEPEIAATDDSATSSSLGGWSSVAIAAGDVIGFNVDSVTTITRATLMLVVQGSGS